MSSYTTPGNARFLLCLTLVFLAMDVFFAVLRLLFVSLLGVTSCLCLHGSASQAEINNLIKYRFEVPNADVEQPDECCICLCDFEGGGQLLLLPCNHPFHSTCIVKWLRLKASCPVCKLLVTAIEQV
ncbi:E3 ubiquitin protein ligase RIE1-like [Bidens hawaiensis]|uniref:E3 ubiquitin protein ligase RIE1-like n=1 Tax=Bidens hawaiensis TaxID=980011 RepID=UPI004049A3B4